VPKPFEIPEKWNLSSQQELVIGSLMDEAGTYIPPSAFCDVLYCERYLLKAAAPAKLRVLIQRCRGILAKHSNNRVDIVVKRNSGWKITKKHSMILRKIVAENS